MKTAQVSLIKKIIAYLLVAVVGGVADWLLSKYWMAQEHIWWRSAIFGVLVALILFCVNTFMDKRKGAKAEKETK